MNFGVGSPDLVPQLFCIKDNSITTDLKKRKVKASKVEANNIYLNSYKHSGLSMHQTKIKERTRFMCVYG